MASFKIVEVFEEEQRLLLKKLAKNLQRYFLIYAAIDLRLKKGPLKLAHQRVYRAEEAKYNSFVFVTTLSSNSKFPSICTTWDCQEIGDRDVGQLLSNIPQWDWNKPFSCYHSKWEMKLKFDNVFKNNFIVANTISMSECYPAKRHLILTVKEEDLIMPKFSSAYKLGDLPPSASSLMLSKWGYFNFKDSVEGLSERIKIYGGTSAHLNAEKLEENNSSSSGIVAWTQNYMSGAIGMTFTLPEHRKNGLGGAITANIAKKCLDEGRYAFVIVDEENSGSLRLHEGFGFKTYSDTGFSLFLEDGKTVQNYLLNNFSQRMANYKVKEVVAEDQLHILKEELRSDWKRNFVIICAIDLRLRKGQLNTRKLRVYQAEDSKYKTFVFITPIASDVTLQTMSVIWNPSEIDKETAGRILSNIPNWNWNKEFVFLGSCGKLKEIFQNLMTNGTIEICTKSMKQVYPLQRGTRSMGTAFMIAKEDIKIPQLPFGYEVGTLPTSSIPQLLSTWDFQFGEATEGLLERLESYKSKAIFYQDPEKEECSVVAWTQQYMFGAIGMTFTLPEHRRKGLGAVVTLTTAKQILDEGGTFFLAVSEINESSKMFHRKLGFKPFGDFGLLVYVPDGKSFDDLLTRKPT